MFKKHSKKSESKPDAVNKQGTLPGEPIGFSGGSPQPWDFLFESTYSRWANSEAKHFFSAVVDHLPEAFRDPKRTGVLYFYSDQGMEGFCLLTVHKFDRLENNLYDVRTVLYPETEVSICTANGDVLYDGSVGPIMDRLAAGDFNFCFIHLKMTHHGLFGFPRVPLATP